MAALAIWILVQSMPETPKPWNRDTVKATFADVFVNTGERPAVTFRSTLENTKSHDYNLSDDPKSPFLILPDGKGMSQEQEISWDRGAYVPHGLKVAVSFLLTYDYNDSYPKADRDNGEKLAKFMGRRLKEPEGIAIVDRKNRYQIIFPKGWQDAASEKREESRLTPLSRGTRGPHRERYVFVNAPMKCWICGEEGTTGEHVTKASDLRALFGSSVTQKNPIYFHTDEKRNQKLGSIKSDKLKSDALICANCNNARTAGHDRAWERLSTFLREKRPPIKKRDLIRLEKVFPGSVTRSMLDVHLFFVKLFGCTIIEHSVPIDIGPFSEAILQHTPHPKVYLAFGPALDMGTGRSNMETANLGGKCVYATWFYIVGSVLVNVMYAEPNEHRGGLIHAWHPSTISKRLHIGAF